MACLALFIAAGARAVERDPAADAALLEFLGEWSLEDGQFIDPVEFDAADAAAQGESPAASAE